MINLFANQTVRHACNAAGGRITMRDDSLPTAAGGVNGITDYGRHDQFVERVDQQIIFIIYHVQQLAPHAAPAPAPPPASADHYGEPMATPNGVNGRLVR